MRRAIGKSGVTPGAAFGEIVSSTAISLALSVSVVATALSDATGRLEIVRKNKKAQNLSGLGRPSLPSAVLI